MGFIFFGLPSSHLAMESMWIDFFFLINNGIVLIKRPGTPGVYMDNSASNT